MFFIFIEAILFDLDGTLLPLDHDKILNNYFKAITHKFKDIIPPKELKANIAFATGAMIRDNRPDKTNQEVFMEHFLSKVDHRAEELMPIFDSFYNHEYKELKACTKPDPTARGIVENLALQGYRLVLATNPVFPREAILERMRWAGVEDIPWELITTYEVCHYCKPNPSYYKEILTKLRLTGERALMVGNDTTQDLAASVHGIKTFLTTDNLIDSGNSPWQPDFKGKLADLPEIVKGPIKS